MTPVMAGPIVFSTKSDSLPGVPQANNYTLRRDLIIYFRVVWARVLRDTPQTKHTHGTFHTIVYR